MKNYLLLLALISTSTFSQTIDTVNVGETFGDYSLLNFEPFDFQVYSEKDGKRRPGVSMTSSIKKIKLDNSQYLAIRHTWTSPNFNGDFYAMVEPETFKPIIQIRNTEKGKEAYQFMEEKIMGLDSASDNKASDYSIDLAFPVFNFEIDLETFSILPMGKNKTFVIPFFHAGNTFSDPSYYSITVEGSENLNIDGVGKVSCWVLFMDYGGKQPTRFWYAKESRKFIKMEAEYNSVKIYKVRTFKD